MFCLTRAPAATIACFPRWTPSSNIAPIPTNASSSIVQACITALCPVCLLNQHAYTLGEMNSKVDLGCSPMVTLSPIIVGRSLPPEFNFATWTRELSCMLVPAPTRILFTSPVYKNIWNHSTAVLLFHLWFYVVQQKQSNAYNAQLFTQKKRTQRGYMEKEHSKFSHQYTMLASLTIIFVSTTTFKKIMIEKW